MCIRDRGQIVLYRGIPQKIGGFKLFDAQYITDIELKKLPSAYQYTLNDKISFENLNEANKYIMRLEKIQKENLQNNKKDVNKKS